MSTQGGRWSKKPNYCECWQKVGIFGSLTYLILWTTLKVEICISSVIFLIWNNYLQVEKKTGPAAVALADVAAAAKFVEDNEIAVLGFFADAEGNILLIIFLNFRFRYTGEYFSSALILELVDPQYDEWRQIVHCIKSSVQENCRFRTWWEHVVYKNCFGHSEQFLHTTYSPHVLQI